LGRVGRQFDPTIVACDRLAVKATRRAWLASIGAGCAVLLAVSAVCAADPPHSAKASRSSTASRSVSKAATKASRAADPTARRSTAAEDDGSSALESPELRSLREAERELFPAKKVAPNTSWPPALPLLLSGDQGPDVQASGVPTSEPLNLPQDSVEGDLSWLARLEMPDLPVRWDEHVVRYLQFFRDDPRGHATLLNLFRHSGRYRDMMRRAFRRRSLPEDLVWVAMIESGFDPAARSRAGAAGLWQFMPETGKAYGLAMDRWLDQRFSAEIETAAAVDLFAELHRRFGSWELALAAYNMGYAGLASVVRRYNTNDFWTLARTEGTLPWETTLYVPKILAASVVAHNLAVFGFGDLASDPPVEADEVDVPPGTPLAVVAQAAGCDLKDIQALNPEIRSSRTPPAAEPEARCAVKVPQGKGSSALASAIAKSRHEQPPLDRYVVRFGESLDQIAVAHKTTAQRLAEINAIAPGEAVRGGTVVLVPKGDAPPATVEGPLPQPRAPTPGAGAASAGPKQSVVVPADEFIYPNRRRVFYRVHGGDSLGEVAIALRSSVDDLCRWNDLDPSARLQEGMTLQAFVEKDADLSHVVVVSEEDVHVVPVGSEEFFACAEQRRGVKRVTVTARAGDTLESVGKRFEVSARTMERVNRRGRSDLLKAGENVVVYVPARSAPPPAPGGGASASNAPLANASPPNGPLPLPPVPDLLP
jgi:membrane-bound lytic murein transglycosylase D